jgi:hypothetical protein
MKPIVNLVNLEPVDADLFVRDELITGDNHDCLDNFNPCWLDPFFHIIGGDHICDFLPFEPYG